MVGTAIKRSNALLRRRRGAPGRATRAPARSSARRHFHRPVVDRRLVGQRAIGHIGDERAALVNLQPRAFGDLADLHRVEVPLLEYRLDFVLAARARPPAACAPATRTA